METAEVNCSKCDKPAQLLPYAGRICRPCRNRQVVERRRQKRIEDPAWHEKVKRALREWRAAKYKSDPAYRDAVVLRNRATSSQRTRRHHLKKAFGLTEATWLAIFEAQGRKCAVCRRDKAGGKGWNTDHCHKTGRVRGILCTACNRGIGNLGDEPARLRAAAEYLEKGQQGEHHAPTSVTTPDPISVSSTQYSL